MQRHEKRAEFWFVAEGEATVYTVDPHSTDRDLLASPANIKVPGSNSMSGINCATKLIIHSD
jgi:hypothetical protein